MILVGRWPNPVRDSGGQHDRRSAVISQVWGDARSEHFTPIKHEPKPSSGPLLAHVKMVPPARIERALFSKPHLMWHKFIEFTEEYQPFCEREFGELIHHRPRTAASPVPAQAVRNLYQAYEARFGDLPELWEEGVPPEVIAYARGRSDTLPPNYRWSGWPGRKAA